MHPDIADVIVIGAGVSGLAAARSLSKRGLRAVLLEASPLIGGRVRTVHVAGWAAPVELGAEFVHGEPATTSALVEAEGLRLRRLADVHALRQGGKFVGMGDTWGRFAAALAPALELRPSWSVQKFLEQHELAASEAELVRLLVEGFHAAPLNDVGAKAIAEDASDNAEGFPQYRLEGGYERLVSKLEHELSAARVEIRLGARVRRLEWQPGRVTVSVLRNGEEQTLSASSCLVSVSIGVLQAEADRGGIEFEPELRERRPALLQLAMGQVQKVVLRLNRAALGSSAHSPRANADFFHDPEGDFPTLWFESDGEQVQATAWAGGPKASALAGLTLDELRTRAVRAVARTLASDLGRVERNVLDAHHHDFDADPLTRGAYSYLRPGAMHAARELALPVENTLFFCGEALDLEYPGTVAGALGSGQHAARQILAARSALSASRAGAGYPRCP